MNIAEAQPGHVYVNFQGMSVLVLDDPSRLYGVRYGHGDRPYRFVISGDEQYDGVLVVRSQSGADQDIAYSPGLNNLIAAREQVVAAAMRSRDEAQEFAEQILQQPCAIMIYALDAEIFPSRCENGHDEAQQSWARSVQAAHQAGLSPRVIVPFESVSVTLDAAGLAEIVAARS